MLRLILAIVTVLSFSSPALAEPLRAAVAANFRPAMADLGAAFEKGTGIRVESAIGSTGQLAAQIANGAPFDLFFAADTTSPARLVKDGHAVQGSEVTYAAGRLALLIPGLEVPRDGTIPDLGDLQRVSIANPRTAPYGIAAMEVLDSLDVAGVDLVLAQNAGGVVAAVASGAAPIGLTALSLAKSVDRLAFWPVPTDLHDPLPQGAVLLSRAVDNEKARTFLDWLQGAEARRIIEAHGYSVD